MVRESDIIHFQTVLSLIYSSCLGKRKVSSLFFDKLEKLSFRIEDILGEYRYRTKHGPFITDYSLAVKVTQAYGTISSLNYSAITEISEHCLKSAPNIEFAKKVCETYRNFTNRIQPLKDTGDWTLHCHIERIESSFVELSERFDHDNRPLVDQSQLSEIDGQRDREINADKLISESLAFFLLTSFLYCDDMDIICQSLMRISKRLDSILKSHDGILPEDILEVMSRFPQPVYQGFIYFITKKMDVDDRVYADLVNAVKKSNLDIFSDTIFEHKLYKEFKKYYDLLKLASSLIRYKEKTSSSGPGIYLKSIFPRPRACLSKVRDFYANYTTDNRRMAAFTMVLYNEIKGLGTEEHQQLVSNLIASDDVIRERFSFYERVNQRHSILSSVSDNATSQNTENSSVKLQSIQNGNIPAKEHLVLNQKLNCIIPEKDIDPFLEYLVWRGYLKEGDQASFKYDVFGGHKPSDYRDVSFNFNTQIVGSMMLGVIIWKLRKENDDPVRLYNKKVTQSNSQIGTGNNAMRVFVDFGLFFPSLVSSLRMKNSDFEPIKMRLIEKVQDLSGSDEYKNSSSILEFIKQQEKKDRNYWFVSKKL